MQPTGTESRPRLAQTVADEPSRVLTARNVVAILGEGARARASEWHARAAGRVSGNHRRPPRHGEAKHAFGHSWPAPESVAVDANRFAPRIEFRGDRPLGVVCCSGPDANFQLLRMLDAPTLILQLRASAR